LTEGKKNPSWDKTTLFLSVWRHKKKHLYNPTLWNTSIYLLQIVQLVLLVVYRSSETSVTTRSLPFADICPLHQTCMQTVFFWDIQDTGKLDACQIPLNDLIRSEGGKSTIIKRACKTMCHEICHMFGLKHCVFYECLMNITLYGPALDCLVFDSVPERYLHYYFR
jgi:hypothetical protein